MIDLDEIEARAAAVYPVDAGWSGYEAEDALPVVTKDVPALVAEVRRLRAALIEVERHIGCLSHLAAGRACEVITRALHPDAPAVAPATLGAGPRDADGREVTP